MFPIQEGKLMEYQIIPITLEHLAGFRAAVDSVSKERQFLAFLECPPLPMSREYVEGNIKDNWPHLVAISDEKVVGWCDITSLHRPVYAHCGELGIGVVAGYRGQGIGEALMKAALQKAIAKGLTRIELTVFEGNEAAMALYQKLGFTIEGIKRKAACFDGKFRDVICMALLYN
jgi:RimJ/RimL family protein N-acetyltransferase